MLYIIVPVHNRADVTARFLDALVRQTGVDFTLILVDDGCTDDTVSVARRAIAPNRLHVLTGNGQLWWAGALQLAYEHLRNGVLKEGDAVLIINDDVTFGFDFLRRGMAALERNRGACIQAVGVDRATGTIDRGAIADVIRLKFRAADDSETPNCLSTRGLLLCAKTFLWSGGFRPRWLPHYLSDYEFTLRLQRQGARLLVDEDFTAQVELGLTGISQPSSGSARQFWADSFSNRAKFNPKHWSAFVLMVCPPWIAPIHLARIWLGFGRSLLRAALPSIGRSSQT